MTIYDLRDLKRLRVLDDSRVLSPSKITVTLKNIVYSEDELAATDRPNNFYIYDNDSFEADDEADFEELLSASVFEHEMASSMRSSTPRQQCI